MSARPSLPPSHAPHVSAVRAFNRFYTQRIGVLDAGLLGSAFSLTEVRVLYELAHRTDCTAADLIDALGLDPGYASRLLQGFERRRLLRRTVADHDARVRHLSLTAAGRRAFDELDARSQSQVAALLAPLAPTQRDGIVAAMRTIQSAFDALQPAHDVMLRTQRPGDIGWVVQRHGELYAAEYGWDTGFEALVARIAGEFLDRYDPAAERCWIAERAGRRVGCVFVVRKNRTTAKLRMLLVEPEARGLGLGRRLVDECIAFSRAAGYRKLVLWTQRNLVAARSLYAACGFRLVDEEPHHGFGHDLVSETWELDLRRSAGTGRASADAVAGAGAALSRQ